MKKTILTSLTLFTAVSLSHAALVLVNFGQTSYTNDGSNTWQTFDLKSASDTSFAAVSSAPLVDALNAASGITLSVSSDNAGSGTTDFTAGPASTAFDSPDVGTLPTWFDSSAAAQRESYTLGSGTIWTYTFDGFDAGDTVNFEFTVGRTSKSSSADARKVDLGYLTREDILDNADTNGVVSAASTGNLTGSTSYSFTIQLDQASNSFAGAINAIGVDITPVPEPATFAIFSGLAVLGLAVYRRRR